MIPQMSEKQRNGLVALFDGLCAVHQSMRDLIFRFGVNKNTLGLVKADLEKFAREHTEAFDEELFPPAGGKLPYTVFRLLRNESNNQDHLYLTSHTVGHVSLPHDHGCFAVEAVISGCEENTIWEETDDGLQVLETRVLHPGDGVALMPDEIHQVKVVGDEPTRVLRFYGKALTDQYPEKTYYDLETLNPQRMVDNEFVPLKP